METESDENDTLDTMNFMTMPKRKPSPFSSKRIVHETSSCEDDNESTRA